MQWLLFGSMPWLWIDWYTIPVYTQATLKDKENALNLVYPYSKSYGRTSVNTVLGGADGGKSLVCALVHEIPWMQDSLLMCLTFMHCCCALSSCNPLLAAVRLSCACFLMAVHALIFEWAAFNHHPPAPVASDRSHLACRRLGQDGP